MPRSASAICPIDGCDPDTTASCYDICTAVTIGSDKIQVCDLDVTASADGDAVGFAIYGNTASLGAICGPGDAYCAWGTDTSGREFYCGWGTYGGDLVGVHLKGGTGDDYLSFQCEENPNPAAYAALQEYTTYSKTNRFEGRIDGAPGNDELIGSDRNSTDYADKLYGWDGDDDISAHGGDDYVDAGGGGDRVCGGDGDDGLFAATGGDGVCGEGGDDNIVLGPGDDAGVGATGTDSVAGGDHDSGDSCGPDGDPTCESTVSDVCDAVTVGFTCP